MIGESSRPKNNSRCVRRSGRKANACRLPALPYQWCLSPISRSSACHIHHKSNQKCVTFTRALCLFPSAGEFDVHGSHRQDVDQQHLSGVVRWFVVTRYLARSVWLALRLCPSGSRDSAHPELLWTSSFSVFSCVMTNGRQVAEMCVKVRSQSS